MGTDSIFYMDGKSASLNPALDQVGFTGDNQRVWLSQSFQEEILTKSIGDEEQICVYFTSKNALGRFSNRWFKNDKDTFNFLLRCRNTIMETRYNPNSKKGKKRNRNAAKALVNLVKFLTNHKQFKIGQDGKVITLQIKKVPSAEAAGDGIVACRRRMAQTNSISSKLKLEP